MSINNELYQIAFPELYKLAEEKGWRIDNYYHKDFRHDKPGWYHIDLFETEIGTSKLDKLQADVIQWMYETVDNCERHCRWYRTQEGMCLKFRYERDYIWFKLKWL
jgi:hypothetical protein